MSGTATAAPWIAASQESDGPSHVVITLIDGTVVTVELRGMDPDCAVGAFFREGFFRVRENGKTRYVSANQIRSIEVAGGKL